MSAERVPTCRICGAVHWPGGAHTVLDAAPVVRMADAPEHATGRVSVPVDSWRPDVQPVPEPELAALTSLSDALDRATYKAAIKARKKAYQRDYQRKARAKRRAAEQAQQQQAHAQAQADGQSPNHATGNAG